jgi:hypothetical protein
MNIFAIDSDPGQAAVWMVDKHVVKMILESAQLLCTAHRMLDGVQYIDKTKTGRNVKRWRLADPQDDMLLYSATHINHPSAVWCRETRGNYEWLYRHFQALCLEYTHRYGKYHKCMNMWDHLNMTPRNINQGNLQEFSVAMDKQYIVSTDPIENYRNYYKIGKARMHKWTKRNPPPWLA